MTKILVLCMCLLLMNSTAFARDLLWPGIIGRDDREIADSAEAPWSAVGRLNTAGYRNRGSCTATLVAPDKIVTAAHCFFQRNSGKLLPLESYRFVLGLSRDKFAAVSALKCIHINPAFDLRFLGEPGYVAADSAVAILEEPMMAAPLGLASDSALKPGATVSHAGYGRDRPFMLSMHNHCRIVGGDSEAALADCDTNLGQSGGPVIIEENGKAVLAGTMSILYEKTATGISGVKAWRKLLDLPSCTRTE
jgi:protease YdgD